MESSEWDAFQTMFSENVLQRVKQLGFEMHTKELWRQGASLTSSIDDLVGYWRILSNLEELGFRRWYLHENLSGRFTSPGTGQNHSCCYEFVYINTHFMDRYWYNTCRSIA